MSASWNLDKLLFRTEELRLLRRDDRVMTAREQLLREVARLDAERKRVAARIALAPFASPLEQAQAHIRLSEVHAMLDALTGGALSHGTTRSRRPGLVSP
mgnify:CR=1 FL=1